MRKQAKKTPNLDEHLGWLLSYSPRIEVVVVGVFDAFTTHYIERIYQIFGSDEMRRLAEQRGKQVVLVRNRKCE